MVDDEISRQFQNVGDYQYEKVAAQFIERGHRFRSIIGMVAYQEFGGQGSIKKAMAGLECIHHAALIYDDLPMMDDAALRKGRQTVHTEFGASTAVLAAVYLQQKGIQLIIENGGEEELAVNELVNLSDTINYFAGKVIQGQEVDFKEKREI